MPLYQVRQPETVPRRHRPGLSADMALFNLRRIALQPERQRGRWQAGRLLLPPSIERHLRCTLRVESLNAIQAFNNIYHSIPDGCESVLEVIGCHQKGEARHPWPEYLRATLGASRATLPPWWAETKLICQRVVTLLWHEKSQAGSIPATLNVVIAFRRYL